MILCPLSARANDKVRLQLNWQHNFKFAGYYAAQEKGYYQAAGLDVELVPSKHWDDPVKTVLEGKAQFGVGTTDLLLRREKGAPVVVLAVIFQHSQLPISSAKDSRRQRVHGEEGCKAMFGPGTPELQACLRNEAILTDKKEHPLRLEDMLPGSGDALSTRLMDKQNLLNKAGQTFQLNYPLPVGIDTYGDNLFTTERQIQLKPEIVEAFRRASLLGWEYATQHPEEMVQLIYSRYSQQNSIEQLRIEARQMEPLLHASLVEIGHLNQARWRNIADVYARLGMMKPGFDIRGFLYDPNKPPQDLRWIYIALATTLTLVLAATLLIIRFSRLSKTLENTIADYKQVGDALRESESLYRSILNASPDDITITDIEGFVRMVSPAGLAMFGYEREEDLLGRNVAEFISPYDRERLRSDIMNMFQGFFSGAGEYRAIRQDGTSFDIESNCQFIRNGEGKPTSMVFIVRDITERKQAGHSCMVAMGEIISAIAHQWRQPLATLGMIIQRAHAVGTMQPLTPDYMGEFKTSAMSQIRYMSDTIDEFRGFYRTEKQKIPFSPLSCTNDAVRLFEPQFTRHCITVDVHCLGCEEQTVDGYPNEFKQVVLNLMGNARDAILESRKTKGQPEEGLVTVRMSAVGEKTLIIDVGDNGCGIADDIAPRILDPYFTTKEDNGGTGLGLFMSRKIVEESLGGRFNLLQYHDGATFRIELPLGKSI